MESTMVGIKTMKLSNYFHHSMDLMPGVLKSLKIRAQTLSLYTQTYVL
jgi:hypothetical protein